MTTEDQQGKVSSVTFWKVLSGIGATATLVAGIILTLQKATDDRQDDQVEKVSSAQQSTALALERVTQILDRMDEFGTKHALREREKAQRQ